MIGAACSKRVLVPKHVLADRPYTTTTTTTTSEIFDDGLCSAGWLAGDATAACMTVGRAFSIAVVFVCRRKWTELMYLGPTAAAEVFLHLYTTRYTHPQPRVSRK